jgi:hypothetical protein
MTPGFRLLAALALAFALGTSTSADPAASEAVRARQHQTSFHHSAVSVDNQKLTTLLGPALSWKFSVPEEQLRRGLVYTGGGGATAWGRHMPRASTTHGFTALPPTAPLRRQQPPVKAGGQGAPLAGAGALGEAGLFWGGEGGRGGR